MLVFTFFILMMIAFSIINKNIYGSYVNYVTVFVWLWCTFTALSSLGPYGFYVPKTDTYVLIFLCVFVFEFSSVLSELSTKRRRHKGINLANNHSFFYGLSANWSSMTFISLVCTIVMVPSFLIGVQEIMSSGIYYLRERSFTNELYETTTKLFLMDVVMPLILVNFMFGAYDLIMHKNRHWVLFISIIDGLMYVLIFGNRFILLEMLILAAIILFYRYGPNMTRIWIRNKTVLYASVFLVLVMVYITQQRSLGGGDSSILFNIYAYFAGSIHLLGVSMNNPETFLLNNPDAYLYGKVFFSSILSFIDLFCKFFHIPFHIESGVATINEITQIFYRVSSRTSMNNNLTMIYGFLRDGGVVAVILETMALAFILSFFYRNRRKNLCRFIQYVFAISFIPFLIFEWYYGRVSVLMAFIILIIYDRFLVHNRRTLIK